MRCDISLVFILCLTKCLGNDYKGFRIYGVTPEDELRVEKLSKVSDANPEFDFLFQPGIVNITARVIVSPNDVPRFEGLLEKNGIKYNIDSYDLAEIIREQISPEPRAGFNIFSSGKISFNKYNRFSDINNYLKKLAKKYNNRVKVEDIGNSYEDRTMKAITITDGVNSGNKRVIFIEAGIHAREWIAPATALYIIQELVENFESNKDLLKNTAWVIVPLVNPDGYEFSHKKDRLWRKTRRPNVNPSCPGTDGNRNFAFSWGKDENSVSECSPTYHGPHAFSEPETRAVRDFMKRFAKNTKLFLSLHSFGRYILLPWSWEMQVPSTYRPIYEIAEAGRTAWENELHQNYMIGRPPFVLHKVAGNSMDYAHAELMIPITITIELAPGKSGFDPSKKEILGLVKEGWVGIKAMASKMQEKYLNSCMALNGRI